MLYTIIDKHPNLIEGKGFSDIDIAAANYLLMMSLKSEITDAQNEIVNILLIVHPKAIELINNLKNYDSILSEKVSKLVDDINKTR